MDTNEQEFELSLILSREQRRINADAILDTLQPAQQDFNVMLIGFADIIQSTFFNHISNTYIGHPEQQAAMEDRLNLAANRMMNVLNETLTSTPEDMVALSTVMLEAIAKALQRQANADQEINTELNNN